MQRIERIEEPLCKYGVFSLPPVVKHCHGKVRQCEHGHHDHNACEQLCCRHLAKRKKIRDKVQGGENGIGDEPLLRSVTEDMQKQYEQHTEQHPVRGHSHRSCIAQHDKCNALPQFKSALPCHDGQKTEEQGEYDIERAPAVKRLKDEPVKGLSDAGEYEKPQGISLPVPGVFVSVCNEEEHHRRAYERKEAHDHQTERHIVCGIFIAGMLHQVYPCHRMTDEHGDDGNILHHVTVDDFKILLIHIPLIPLGVMLQ